jgi:hypothetical protein
MSSPQTEPPKNNPKPRQGRSPGFPFLSLDKALERADQFRIAEGGRPKHYAPLASAAKAWSLGSKTGPFLQTVAALGQYELVDFQGGGENRTVRLTETALNILLDKQPISPERDNLIQKIALAPRIHSELWQKWKDGLPSNATLETYLIRDRGFTESGAKDLITQYKATISFAKLGQPAIMSSIDVPIDEKLSAQPPLIEVGDFVQVEINGAFQFEVPKRVKAVMEHEGQPWIFVDGSQTGIPMSQATLETKGVAHTATPPILPVDVKENLIAAGEREWLRGPLAKDVNYRLIVSGDIGPREIGKLIKLLTAQKAVLSDDDDDEG